MCLLAAAFLCRTLVRLELDELLGHVVVVALGEDAQDGETRLVHVDAFPQRQPAGHAAFGSHVLQLQDGHAHGAVLSREAVILHTHLQLVALRPHLAAQGAAEDRISSHYKCSTGPMSFFSYSFDVLYNVIFLFFIRCVFSHIFYIPYTFLCLCFSDNFNIL